MARGIKRQSRPGPFSRRRPELPVVFLVASFARIVDTRINNTIYEGRVMNGIECRRARLQLERLESRELMTVTLNVGMNISFGNLSGDQSETSIAINPTNASNLYAVSNTSRHYTLNGGATWLTAGALPGGSCCDNKAVFDKFGNLFVSYINGSGSDSLAMSTNGGASFTSLLSSGIGFDYPGVAVGPDGTGQNSVWAFGSSSGATMSARGAQVTGLGLVGTFTAAQTSVVGQFGDIAIGKDGRVTISGTHCTGSSNGPCPIKVATDFNGLAAGGFSAPVTVVTSNVGTFTPIPAEDNRTIHAHPNQSYDIKSGRLYLTYTDRPSTGSADTDIYMQFSNDGVSWEPRIKLNDDGATGKSQFFSDIDVDETTGRIAATWYDARNSPTNDAAQIYASVSAKRGYEWIPNVQIATGLSNANQAGSFEFGDYDTMDFYGGVFYRTWADNASPSTLTPPNTDAPGDQDMATARVEVIFAPSPIAGWFGNTGFDEAGSGRVPRVATTDVTPNVPNPSAAPSNRQSTLSANETEPVTARASVTISSPKRAVLKSAEISIDPAWVVVSDGLTTGL
jgi:hypothetical protein